MGIVKRVIFVTVALMMILTCLSYHVLCEEGTETPKFDWKGAYSEDLAPVCVNNKYGYVDCDDRFVIQPNFWGASNFHHGTAVVCQTGSSHDQGIIYIDKNGNTVKTFLDVLKENSHKRSIFMKNYYSVMANPGLQMRKSPNSEGKKMLLIPFGEKVKVLKKTKIAVKAEGLSGFWYLAEFKRKRGYVFSGFLTQISIRDFYRQYLNKIYGHFDKPTTKIYIGTNKEELYCIDPSGIIYVYAYVCNTDNILSTVYIPRISLQEGFWFIKNFMPDLMVLKLGDRTVNTMLKNIAYPANNGRIILYVDNTEVETDLIIEKDRFGYVRITY